ncbi:MAG: ABC transporter permease subunit [Alphaproteobacteria bacterium]|jgi:general L-amino acid transport system permease protein|nr:ABC transporter permease subunit [Rhodospirillaceae bacterium]MBT6206188.1 ABC transporter permease subunit [Rhodospirillaceae bacterium]MBT6509772.1 ABC transporter permease subunit [Rhodospirillaceae bacterium]MBT7612391.1 ABC transporter permease subunit [Rhodospirillaceae bacterium]MDG2482404.1 ABC transporter permease subunit [Alphaproteobacteria bacterium]
MTIQTGESEGLQPAKAVFYNDPKVRAVFWQIVAVLGVVGVFWFLIHNTMANLDRQNIASGFSFLNLEAGFAIGEGMIPYTAADPYWHAIIVGLLNTIKVAVVGIVFATIIGSVVGIMRLSPNWLVARLATVYIETLRNVPLLLQLFFWYAMIVEVLPRAKEAYGPFLGVYLSNRGFNLPLPDTWSYLGLGAGILIALVTVIWLYRRNKKIHDETGEIKNTLGPGMLIFAVAMLLGWLAGGAPTTLDSPEFKGFSFKGGAEVTAEFLALWLGLTLYTASFIAEIVRSGILAVSKGQWEAAGSLGLSRTQILRFIVLPQSLRVIIPPTTSQYLNLTKNSSLAVAIGYPDIVGITNTTINQSGQAIEGIAIIMAVYLSLSLSISLFMNWYNNKIALVER